MLHKRGAAREAQQGNWRKFVFGNEDPVQPKQKIKILNEQLLLHSLPRVKQQGIVLMCVKKNLLVLLTVHLSLG